MLPCYDCKLNVFGFWTVSQTNQAIQRRHHGPLLGHFIDKMIKQSLFNQKYNQSFLVGVPVSSSRSQKMCSAGPKFLKQLKAKFRILAIK